MKPDSRFSNQSNEFWAWVKYASETLGYSIRSRRRGDSRLKTYRLEELLVFGNLFSIADNVQHILDYLNFRADLVNSEIRPLLMDRDEARQIFEKLTADYIPRCYLPMNKQSGEKRHYSYFTCIINVLTERNLNGSFDDNPGRLCFITDKTNRLVKALSRRVDGAYPSTLNPRAIWEIKEYYGTTTFGSRVADGVYETQLDGYEIIAAQQASGNSIQHYLFVDDRYTWWDLGKSYLCRIIDMMHEGLVDEVIFGKEVITRWPQIVKTWQ